MAENRTPKTGKSTRLSAGMSYTIGGRRYDASDLQPQYKQVTVISGMENAPRQISNSFENQYGKINTAVGNGVSEIPKPASSYPYNTVQNQAQTAPLSQNQIVEMKETFTRYGATNNLTTRDILRSEQYAKAYSYTSSYAESVRTVNTLGSMSNSEYFHGVGVTAKYTVNTEAAKALERWKTSDFSTGIVSGGKVALGKAESSLNSNDDLGSQAIGGTIAAGVAGASTFKVAQQATEIGIHSIKTVGNGIYQVSTTAGLTSVTVGRTAKTVIEKQVVPLSKETISIFKSQAQKSGLNNAQIVKGIVNRVDSVKTAVNNFKSSATNVAGGVKAIYHTVDKSVRIVHGVTTGKLTVDAAKLSAKALGHSKDVLAIKNGIKTGVRAGAGYVARGTVKGASVAAFRGVPATGRVLKNGTLTVAGMMMSSDDMAVKGIGTTITATDIGIKTAVTGTKAAGYTVKTAVKGGKTVYKGAKAIYNGLQIVRNQGLRAAWNKARKMATTKLLQAGKSVVSMLFAGIKAIGIKYILPLALICALGVVALGGVSSVAAYVGSLFGGAFSTTDTKIEYDIREYLEDASTGVPMLSLDYRQDLANEMQGKYNSFDVVRFYSNTGSSDVIEPTFEGVTSVFPTNDELVNMLQPIFNAMLLMKYDLAPTETEAAVLIDELFEGLFRVTTVESVEYCGQSLRDGDGAVETHSCGNVHALSDCPNFITGTHTDFTCDECDTYYYVCKGHAGSLSCNKHIHDNWLSPEYPGCYGAITCGNNVHSHTVYCYSLACGLPDHTHSNWVSSSNPGCYSTIYCNNRQRMNSPCSNSERYFECTGYKYCNSHKVISYTLTLDGVYALENKYFLKPINQLSNLSNPNVDQTKQLNELKDYYEIFKEMMSLVAQEYGGGLTMSDLSGVNFVNGTRVSNQAVVDLALSQVGQQGGQPYWSYYGFGSRVEWCACFVHWCMRNTPSASPAYPNTSNNAYCPTLAAHFQSLGQWGDKNYTNLVAGDTIFFDWEGDGITDHIGIVIGQDGSCVYTVEGNSGDAVRMRQYSIGSSVIYGYGLMNY